ncbi:hypothetical protein [Fontivita pretiosa]|uniref:GREB1-related protein n=1 Tax=Fontivita pretiosa TaxID=2989684 RepID=UPI003D179749
MKIVIPSKGRASVISDKALRLFPDATVCIGDDELEAYSRVTSNLLVHPASVVGIGPLRQWVMDHVEDRCVVMVDDDVTHVYSQVGFHKRRIEDADTARAIVERLAILAADAGVRVFGFQQAARPLTYANFRPFSLNTWVGGLVGIIGRELRYDTSLLLRADIDFCLQSLVHDRIVLVDGRYSFIHTRFAGAGGNAQQRSAERHEQEIRYLKRKWGPYLDVVQAKGTTRLVVRVVR